MRCKINIINNLLLFVIRMCVSKTSHPARFEKSFWYFAMISQTVFPAETFFVRAFGAKLAPQTAQRFQAWTAIKLLIIILKNLKQTNLNSGLWSDDHLSKQRLFVFV